jgi:ubiquinone/menaquinone biosynthesis C-methylase UbiE
MSPAFAKASAGKQICSCVISFAKMIQDDYRHLYKELNPHWNDSVSIYKSLVRENINKQSIVLEAGCGFSDLFREEYERAKRVIGVDISEEFLKMNNVVDEKIVSDLESIPQVNDSSIDLIISSWVFEHLKHPEKVFKEFGRVLKRGGKVIFLTPNSWNYVVFLNRIIPESLREFIVGRMSKNLVTDPMLAYYRANSKVKIKKLARISGLKVEEFVLNGDPTYVAINKLFFYMGVLVEFFLNLPFLRNFRVHLTGVLKKP